MKANMEQFPATNPNPVLSAAKDGTILYSNDAGEPLLYEWGIEVGDKLPPNIRDLVQGVIARNKPQKIEVKNGKRIYLVAFHPLPEEECVNIYGFDISNQRELNEKLYERERRCNQLFENMLDGFAYCKMLYDDFGYPVDFIYFDTNRAFEQLTGLKEVKGKRATELFPRIKELHPELFDIYGRVALTGQPERFEIDFKPLEMWFSISVYSTEREHFVTVFDDITDRKLAERGLRESESNACASAVKLQTIIDSIEDGIIILDKNGVIVTANKLAKHIFRLIGHEFHGTSHERVKQFQWFFPDGTPINDNSILSDRVLSGETISDLEIVHREENSNQIWLTISGSPLRRDTGEIFGVVLYFKDITERKRVEEAFKLTQASVDLASDYILWITPGGEVIYANNAACESLKYSRDDLKGMHVWDFDPIYTKEVWLEHWLEIKKRGSFTFESLHHAKDGKEFPVEVSVNYVRSGDMEFNFAYIKDITNRKQAEEALKNAYDSLDEKVKERTAELETAYDSLKESERHLSEAQKIAHLGNWEWDIATDKACWSDELYRIFGLKPQELEPSYNEYLNYVHPDDRNYVADAFKNSTNGKPYSIDHRVVLANGKECTVHIQSEIISDEKNIPTRIKGIVQDITERTKTEEEIKNLANIVESSEDAIGTLTLDGIITSWNKGAEQVYSYSAEEILGKHVSILAPSHLKDETMRLSERVKQGEKIRNHETTRQKKDGKIIYVSFTLSPVFDIHGKLTAVSFISRDITKRKEAEEALAKIEIARKQEIHHRIKNNLQVISSLLDLQAEKFKDREEIKDSEVLDAFMESQNRVISMALIHEELYKGGAIDTLNFSPYIEELANSLFQTYRVGNSDISLKMDFAENIFFDMDAAVPLGIIVNEIVSNSLKHAFIGRDKGEIIIKLHREGKGECQIEECKSTTYVLSVSDNGIGIPDDLNIEDLNTLGMKLVTTLVDQLDGELELKRGDGTEFIMRFTVAEDDDKASKES